VDRRTLLLYHHGRTGLHGTYRRRLVSLGFGFGTILDTQLPQVHYQLAHDDQMVGHRCLGLLSLRTTHRRPDGPERRELRSPALTDGPPILGGHALCDPGQYASGPFTS
jgi:hypothetical protein